LAGLHGLWTAWRNRRVVAQLLASDDRLLADIGITRGDVQSALTVPLERDPSTRLVVLATERRASRLALARERARKG